MDAHFKLLPRIFIHKRGTVDCIFFYLRRERYGTDYFRIVADSSIHDLFYRKVKNLVFVSAHTNPETLNFLLFWSNARALTRSLFLFCILFCSLYSHMNTLISRTLLATFISSLPSALCHYLCNNTSTNSLASLSNRKSLFLFKGDRSYKLYLKCNGIARHYHFHTFLKGNLTCYVRCTDVKLRLVSCKEWRMTATFPLFKDVY